MSERIRAIGAIREHNVRVVLLDSNNSQNHAAHGALSSSTTVKMAEVSNINAARVVTFDLPSVHDGTSCNITFYQRIGFKQNLFKVRAVCHGTFRLYRYCPWLRGMAASQISCYNGTDKKVGHVHP